jgi:hypothetical protein
MPKAFDLRKLIAAVQQEQLLALKVLWSWARDEGNMDLPSDFSVMEAQHIAVTTALCKESCWRLWCLYPLH